MNLSVLWFGIIAVLWIGYLVLEGFDFGVGMLTSFFPRGSGAERDTERRVLINTIGPHWDGNEVWLLTAGGATFAAFPEWYATLFSGFYLPLLLILLALIIRGVSFEYRGKIDDPRWSRVFELGVMIGSWIPSFLWGVAFANLVRGVLLDANHQYVGGFWALLNPFALLGGVATTVLFLLHGSLFVALKTYGKLHERALRYAKVFALGSIVVAAIWGIWAYVAYSHHSYLRAGLGAGLPGVAVFTPRNPVTLLALIIAALALVAALLMVLRRREGLAFALSSVALAAVVVLIFSAMYPFVLPGRPGGFGMTLFEASSTPYTLRVMTIVALILTPLVIAYQIWSFRVFRRRLSTSDIPAPAGLTWQRLRQSAFVS